MMVDKLFLVWKNSFFACCDERKYAILSTREYRKGWRRMKEISAGGVVYRKKSGQLEILMIEDRFGYVTLPKGKQEPGESLEQTALREIEEETGIRGRMIMHLCRVYYQYQHDHKGLIDKQVDYYLVEAESGQETPQLEEIQGVKWLPANEARKKQLEQGYENNHSVLEKALDYLEKRGVELNMDQKALAAMIDHTLLKPDATEEQVRKLCEEALTYQFASVCVNAHWVKKASEWLQGSAVKVCTVVGFPLGATTKETKAFETRQAIKNGASEIDMVLNIGALKSGDENTVKDDIAAVVEAADGYLVKVILETGLLSEDEIVKACQLAKEAGAHFVKTSTGFGYGGATVEHVQLMRKTVGDQVGVKASGGIRDGETARKMIEAGANRIGASSSVAIVSGEIGQSGY